MRVARLAHQVRLGAPSRPIQCHAPAHRSSRASALGLGPSSATRQLTVGGRERWRAEVPAAFATGRALTRGFVALSHHRTIVRRPDGALVAWDALTGKPVA
jgi:hypothetical protein